MEDLAQKSTAIVRARVSGSHSAYRGADIYTYFQLEILEVWKSSGQTPTEVAVPGGAVGGIRQSVAGAPVLKPGEEYVVFLWTSRSGLTQVIGLTQGLFSVQPEATGDVASRPAAAELMLDQAGRAVADRPVNLRLQELRSRVRQALGAAK